MKAVTKIIAAIATVPVAGLITLGSAGAATAITCAPGYIETVAANGASFCAARNDGGVGGGGTGTIGNGGSTAPGQAVPVAPPVQQAPPAPPAAPAPAPAPIQVAPAPVTAPKAPAVQAPAPVQNNAPSLTDSVNQAPLPAAKSDTPVGAISPEIVKSEASKDSETDANSTDPAAEKPVAGITPAPAVKKSATASPSASASQGPNLEVNMASDTENTPKSIPGILIALGVILIALLTLCIITINRNRKAARR